MSQTKSSLEFGQRAKKIINQVKKSQIEETIVIDKVESSTEVLVLSQENKNLRQEVARVIFNLLVKKRKRRFKERNFNRKKRKKYL